MKKKLEKILTKWLLIGKSPERWQLFGFFQPHRAAQSDGSGLHLEPKVIAGNPACLRMMICKKLVLVLRYPENISAGVEAVITNTRNFSFAAADFWISLCVGLAEGRAWYAESKMVNMFKLGKEYCV